MTGFRHVERGSLPRFADSVVVKIYPSGERRIRVVPSKDLLAKAFEELGTLTAVAAAFGVTRQTAKHWAAQADLQIVSRPEAGLATTMKKQFASDLDKCRVAQWLMDEGSVSVAYFARGNYTILLVCGAMSDYDVLSSISAIVQTPITSSKAPGPTTLPMGAIRVQSARAYALLEVVLPLLVGLKGTEAEAALKFFPTSGLLRGRHTTDEFLVQVWRDFAHRCLTAWNSRRKVKVDVKRLEEMGNAWVEGRIKRARRFLDAGREPATS
jgi:hypothetical protein